MFDQLPGAKLFLNCAGNAWYQNGIGGDIRSLRELVTAIGRFSEGFEQTHFIGHSMGAYLALICAHEFDRGGHFVATSPEAVLCRRASRSRDNHVAPRFGWRDLTRRYARRPLRTPGVTLFGAYDPVDALFLAEAGKSEAFYGEVATVPHHHGVTEYLTRNRRYQQLLESPPAEVARMTQNALSGPASAYGTVEQFRRFHTAYAKLRAGDVSRAAHLVRADAEWQNAGWQALAASIHRRMANHDEAVAAGRRAFAAAPAEALYARELALSLIAAQRPGELRKLHKRLAGRKAPGPGAQRVLAEIERSGLLEIRRGKAAAQKPPLPDWLTDLAAFERERAARRRDRRHIAFARELAAAFPMLEPPPALAHAIIETLVAAGLRQTAVTLLEGREFPGARGLGQRLRLLLPNPVERYFDGNFY
ncbi:hypothetical protein KHP62_01200 [Rhodobacteraceae bacterium NNCM2]|nr:hypothetical protein [Coraliihabitans acroporae]